ncbi:MAG: ankyrin repeat domain-containing protein [Cytophagales bacterium]|nr:ankyrin repeat domain-containing protein [Cytophagales bacterium]
MQQIRVVSPLHAAASSGHQAVVKYLTEHGAEINAKDIDGVTPLSRAAGSGHQAIVEYFLSQRAEINAKDNDGKTLLHWAARYGQKAIVEYLQSRGVDINTTTTKGGLTPLSFSASGGHQAVVEYLIEHGAEINAKDEDGGTPLHHAARNGHQAIVEYLLSQGAEINAKDKEGVTPIHLAARYGHQAMEKYFKLFDMINTDNYILLREMLKKNNPDNQVGASQTKTDNSLHILQQLLRLTGNLVSLRNNNEQISLSINEIIEQEIIEKKGVRMPLLHWWCCEGKSKLVAELLYGRAEQHVNNITNWLMVEQAAVSRDMKINIEFLDSNGFFPLHYAAREGHLEIVKMLVEYKEIIEENSVEQRKPKYTDYIFNIVNYVNQKTSSEQKALQLAKDNQVKAYLKGIRKGAYYYCLTCVRCNPLSELNFNIPCIGQLGFTTVANKEADVMQRRFNKYRVWSKVRRDRAQPLPETSSR